MDKPITQAEQIRAHLEAGNRITALEALYQFRCLRLAARINELKHDGMAINSEMIEENGKHYSQYFTQNTQQPCGQ